MNYLNTKSYAFLVYSCIITIGMMASLVPITIMLEDHAAFLPLVGWIGGSAIALLLVSYAIFAICNHLDEVKETEASLEEYRGKYRDALSKEYKYNPATIDGYSHKEAVEYIGKLEMQLRDNDDAFVLDQELAACREKLAAANDDSMHWENEYNRVTYCHARPLRKKVNKLEAQLNDAEDRARDFEIQVNDANYKIADFNALIDSNAAKHQSEVNELSQFNHDLLDMFSEGLADVVETFDNSQKAFDLGYIMGEAAFKSGIHNAAELFQMQCNAWDNDICDGFNRAVVLATHEEVRIGKAGAK